MSIFRDNFRFLKDAITVVKIVVQTASHGLIFTFIYISSSMSWCSLFKSGVLLPSEMFSNILI